MYRILHLADVHLDASFATSGLPPAIGTWRRGDLRAALGRTLTIARERHVDAVTIAGDLYEQDFALPDTAAFLVQHLAKLAPIRVFVAPGEHDPYANDSLYALTRWPENVSVFSQPRLSSVELAPHILLWGAAHPAARAGNALAGMRLPEESVNLLLLHAADTAATASAGSVAFVANLALVEAAGFDAAFLGHVHAGQLHRGARSWCVYPGSPDPLAPAEEHAEHNAVIVTVDNGSCTAEVISIGQWHYTTVSVDLTGCASNPEAQLRVVQALRSITIPDSDRLVCYVHVTGIPPTDFDAAALSGQLQRKAHIVVKTSLAMPYNLEQLAREQTVRGLLVRRFQQRLSSTTDEVQRRKTLSALHIALRALDGKQVGLHEID